MRNILGAIFILIRRSIVQKVSNTDLLSLDMTLICEPMAEVKDRVKLPRMVKFFVEYCISSQLSGIDVEYTVLYVLKLLFFLNKEGRRSKYRINIICSMCSMQFL